MEHIHLERDQDEGCRNEEESEGSSPPVGAISEWNHRGTGFIAFGGHVQVVVDSPSGVSPNAVTLLILDGNQYAH